MQGLAAAILCRAGPVLEALRPGGMPPETSKGTFSQHTGGQQAPVPEAEGGPTSVGRSDLGLTSGLGLGHSSGWNIDTEDWRGRGIWGGNSSPGPMGTPGHGSAYHPTDPNISDKVMYLQMAFKQRPLRDGGGKPSLGRLALWARPLSKAAVLGARICVLTSPWGDKLQESLSLGEGSHPFQGTQGGLESPGLGGPAPATSSGHHGRRSGGP